jgi:hypothetical protein
MQSLTILKPYYMTDKYLVSTSTLRADHRTADFVFKSSDPQNDSASGTGRLEKQVWFLTQGRADSLSTYDMLGRLISTERYFWSPQAAGSIRPRPAGGRPGGGSTEGVFSLLGRRLPRGKSRGNLQVTIPSR